MYHSREDVIAVRSVMYGVEQPLPTEGYVTVGIHPMQDDVSDVMKRLGKDSATLKQEMLTVIAQLGAKCCGIGECGWDRRSPLSWEDQDALMKFQYDLARELHLPIILHTVGGLHRLLSLKARVPQDSAVRWYVHGFRGKPELLEQLIRAGIGVSLSPSEHTPPEVLKKVKATSFFLETDDSVTPIESVYAHASRLMDMPLDALRHRLCLDFQQFLRGDSVL